MSGNIRIGGVETFSTVDFPNRMAAVVFMQGCPWRCPFCHNKDLQKIGAETTFIWDKFFEFLVSRKGILDAVVFSGGEPLVQDCLSDYIEQVKNLGYQIGLHTGGYRPEAFAKVLPLVDWVGFDIKAPLEEARYHAAVFGKYHADPSESPQSVVTSPPPPVTASPLLSVIARSGATKQSIFSNMPFSKILASLQLLVDSGKPFECRTTCDPRILSIEDIYKISDDLKALGVREYYLQRYRQVDGDTTPDSECDKFFEDVALAEYLKNSFEIFDFRK